MNKSVFLHKIRKNKRAMVLFDKSIERCVGLFIDKTIDRVIENGIVHSKYLDFEIVRRKENALSNYKNQFIINNKKNHGLSYVVTLNESNINKIESSTKLYRNVD